MTRTYLLTFALLAMLAHDVGAQTPVPAPPQPPPPPQVPAPPRTPAPPSRRPKEDQTVAVTKGMRLAVNNFAGSINVRTWEKDAVRVESEHSERDRVTVRPMDAVLRIGATSEHGPSRTVDFTLTVPRWMPIALNGTYVDIDL